MHRHSTRRRAAHVQSHRLTRLAMTAATTLVLASTAAARVAAPIGDPVIAPLDPFGFASVPDVHARLHGEDTASIVVQDPPAGTEHFGTGELTVRVTATDVNGLSSTRRHAVRFVDHTPPALDLRIVAAGPADRTPFGLDYYVGDEAVIAVGEAVDAVDGTRTVELLVNGMPLGDAVAVIDEPGIHRVEARTTDRSGNVATDVRTFQVRSRAVEGASVAVESIVLDESPEGLVGLDATLLLGSLDFDPRDLMLSTVSLWLGNDEDRLLNPQPIRIAGAFAGGTRHFRPQFTDASYEDGLWRMRFVADFRDRPLTEVPSRLFLTANGDDGLMFDVLAEAPAKRDRRPLDLLGDVRFESPPMVAQAEAATDCEWRFEAVPYLPPTKTCNIMNGYDSFFCAAGYSILLKVDPDTFGGTGNAFASGAGLDGSCGFGTSWCALSNGMTKWVFQSGSECCDECTITITASPTFRASVSLDPNGSAKASGSIGVATSCGNTSAVGSVTMNQAGQAFGTINNIPFVTPVIGGGHVIMPTAAPPLNCTVNGCQASVTITTSATIEVLAYTSLFNNYAQADAALNGANAAINVVPFTEDCDDPGPDTFPDEWCWNEGTESYIPCDDGDWCWDGNRFVPCDDTQQWCWDNGVFIPCDDGEWCWDPALEAWYRCDQPGDPCDELVAIIGEAAGGGVIIGATPEPCEIIVNP